MNTIAKDIYSQIKSEVRQFVIMIEIIDHKKDLSAICQHESFSTPRNGNQVERKTTKGRKLCVEWKDGTMSWVPFRELKVSNPVEVAEYVIANKIVEKPALT